MYHALSLVPASIFNLSAALMKGAPAESLRAFERSRGASDRSDDGSTSLVVGPTVNGIGIFAERTYRRGQIIDKIEGRITHHSLLWKRGGTFAANCIRFGPSTYIDPSNAAGRYLNHCCLPNAGIHKWNNQLFLFAAGRIGRGTEIVIDYSTTLGDDDIWTMRCNCRTESCRKTIRHFGSLPSALRLKYFQAGLVPKYIIQTLDADPPSW